MYPSPCVSCFPTVWPLSQQCIQSHPPPPSPLQKTQLARPYATYLLLCHPTKNKQQHCNAGEDQEQQPLSRHRESQEVESRPPPSPSTPPSLFPPLCASGSSRWILRKPGGVEGKSNIHIFIICVLSGE